MQRRWVWSLGGASLLAGITAVVWNSGPALPTLRFADGTSTRVLKVSFGTRHSFSWEPIWKRSVRMLLPAAFQKGLGPARNAKFTTAYDSLVLYLEPIQNRTDPLERVTIEALFPGSAEFATRWMPASVSPVIINNYARNQKEIVLRFSDRLGQIQIKVPNPRPATRASWSVPSSPETNYTTGTKIVLKQFRKAAGSPHELVLGAYSTMGAHVGWTQWRTTLFDPLGNWSTDTSTRKPNLPGAMTEHVFKVLAEGHEYISAGYFPIPTNHEHHVIPVKPRMSNWGVRFVALFGPGTYEVSKSFEIKTRNTKLPATNILKAAWSSWIVECVQPVSLCLSDRPVSDVRLRERFPNNQGRIFYGAPTTSVSKGNLTAQLFTPRLRAPLLPPVFTATTDTNILEAEVVVRWPTVEFFVQKPE